MHWNTQNEGEVVLEKCENCVFLRYLILELVVNLLLYPNPDEMKRNILYYPTINIPTNDWLKNAVLYWDEVSSIVPKDYKDKPLVNLNSDIDYLMCEGEFRAIKPDTLIKENWKMLKQFQDEMIEIIESPQFKSVYDKRLGSYSRIHDYKVPKTAMGKGPMIHQDKISMSLIDFLKDKGLARKIKDNHEWLMFERTTALVYMSVLAKYLAYVDKQQTVIGTDLAVYEKLNFQPLSDGEVSAVLSCDLRGLIPSPGSQVKIKDIVKFKRKRASNLASFRKMLMDVQKKISKAESNEHLKDILVSFEEDLRKGITDMAAVFRDSKIDLIFKSLKTLFNYKSAALVTGAAVLLNEKYKVTGLPTWVEGIAIVAGGAIDIGNVYIDARNKQKAESRKNAFAYLYHAQKNGIVNKF
jgi:hypothetical protein